LNVGNAVSFQLLVLAAAAARNLFAAGQVMTHGREKAIPVCIDRDELAPFLEDFSKIAEDVLHGF